MRIVRFFPNVLMMAFSFIGTVFAEEGSSQKPQVYRGNQLNQITELQGLAALDFHQVYQVVVSGDGPNPCGHMILYVPAEKGPGWYFHVAGGNDFLQIMNEAAYQDYLKRRKKVEWGRYPVVLYNPIHAEIYLANRLQNKWIWGLLPHNCAGFVDSVLAAGESNEGIYTNCPRFRVWGDKAFLKKQWQRFHKNLPFPTH